MASRRGQSNDERLGLDMAQVSASSTVVAGKCFVYAVQVTLTDTNATGLVTLADSSASGDAAKEVAKLRFKLGAGGVSAAGGAPIVINLAKPWFVQNTLVCAVTNAEVAAEYLAA